jgi:hypothetical protein
MSNLGATLTIRLSPLELRRLRERARAAKTTPSAVVRDLVAKDLAEPQDALETLGARSARWIGAISDARVPQGRKARESLTGWSPDRRG